MLDVCLTKPAEGALCIYGFLRQALNYNAWLKGAVPHGRLEERSRGPAPKKEKRKGRELDSPRGTARGLLLVIGFLLVLKSPCGLS